MCSRIYLIRIKKETVQVLYIINKDKAHLCSRAKPHKRALGERLCCMCILYFFEGHSHYRYLHLNVYILLQIFSSFFLYHPKLACPPWAWIWDPGIAVPINSSSPTGMTRQSVFNLRQRHCEPPTKREVLPAPLLRPASLLAKCTRNGNVKLTTFHLVS